MVVVDVQRLVHRMYTCHVLILIAAELVSQWCILGMHVIIISNEQTVKQYKKIYSDDYHGYMVEITAILDLDKLMYIKEKPRPFWL